MSQKNKILRFMENPYKIYSFSDIILSRDDVDYNNSMMEFEIVLAES